jgi:hypothetical protein
VKRARGHAIMTEWKLTSLPLSTVNINKKLLANENDKMSR